MDPRPGARTMDSRPGPETIDSRPGAATMDPPRSTDDGLTARTRDDRPPSQERDEVSPAQEQRRSTGYLTLLMMCHPKGLFCGSYDAMPISPTFKGKPTSPKALTMPERGISAEPGVAPLLLIP